MNKVICSHKDIEDIFQKNQYFLRNHTIKLTTKADFVMNQLIKVLNIDCISSLRKKDNIMIVESYFQNLNLTIEEKEICEYIMRYMKSQQHFDNNY